MKIEWTIFQVPSDIKDKVIKITKQTLSKVKNKEMHEQKDRIKKSF